MSGTEQRNIEIKVHVSANAREDIVRRVTEMNARAAGASRDVDTYFRVPHGRLKLRVHNDEPDGTLIYYERPDEATSRLSHYRLISIPDAAALGAALTAALGVLVIVTKRRTVAIYGATRIHFDAVEGLGNFIELETVLGTQGHDAALAEHRFVFDTLGLSTGQIEPRSYSDLLLQRNRPNGRNV
jgi:predicted adenylyl cyclase CyaB